MKPWIFLMCGFACTGCTALSLERHSLCQGESATELRYLEVMENLAMVAHDPSALPAYSSIFAGTAQVADTEQLSEQSLWVNRGITGNARAGFLTQTASPLASRSVSENWSLDPLLHPEKLEALRCCCRWVLYGQEKACESCPGLLQSPLESPTPGRHFGVSDRLAHLPAGWLNVGCLTDVPLTACYKGHYCGTWVWVTKDGMQGLADFTLIVQDIARVGINSDSLYFWPPPPCTYVRSSPVPDKQEDRDKITTVEVTANVELDPQMHLVAPTPYRQVRYENLGADSSLRSQISATGP